MMNTVMCNEEVLDSSRFIQGLQNGNASSYEALVRIYGRKMFSIAR
jgi:hypothetical protein